MAIPRPPRHRPPIPLTAKCYRTLAGVPRRFRWIQVQEASNEPLAQILKQTLDRGEAEAIALAIELKADWTLLDEREGRKVAKSLGLNVTGILGILLRAKQANEIKSLQPVIDDLINKAGFRIAPELLAQILSQ